MLPAPLTILTKPLVLMCRREMQLPQLVLQLLPPVPMLQRGIPSALLLLELPPLLQKQPGLSPSLAFYLLEAVPLQGLLPV